MSIRILIYFILAAIACGQNSFTTGQVSPLVEDRIDLKQHKAACRQLENMIPFPQGTANKRPGTKLESVRPITESGPYVGYKLTYISENGAIYGLPTTDTIVAGLDAGKAAVNNGDGTVSLPFIGHPFDDGWTVYITGTSNYDGAEVIQSGSTGTNYITVIANYNAETFDGTERVSRYFSLASGTGGCCQDSSGNVYYGHSAQAVENYSCVTKITPDGTRYEQFFTPDGGWPELSTYNVTGVKVDSTNTYLYVLMSKTTSWVYKFMLSDGSQVWVSDAFPTSYEMDIDTSDNVYIGGAGDSHLYGGGAGGTEVETLKISSSTGAKTSLDFPRIKTAYETYVDVSLGIVIVGGSDFYIDTAPTDALGWNVQVADLDGTNWRGIRLGGITLNYLAAWITDYTIGKGQIWTYDGYIYVVCAGNDTLYKLNTSLEIIDTVEITDLEGGYYDLWGNLVLVSSNSASPPTNLFTWLDPDTLDPIATESLSSYSPLSPLSLWSANVYSQGDVFFWPGINSGGTAQYWPPDYLTSVDEYAIKIIPFDFTTDGDYSYVVEFGKNYVGFYRAGAQIEN